MVSTTWNRQAYFDPWIGKEFASNLNHVTDVFTELSILRVVDAVDLDSKSDLNDQDAIEVTTFHNR